MDILTQKRITDNGDGKGYFRHCINYVYKEKPEHGEELILTRGFGVSYYNPNHTYNQMYAVKKYFGKTGDNPIMHFVISFDNNVRDALTACDYMYKIALFFADNYQLIYAVNKEDQGGSKYHGHIIVNTVNYKNGKLYHSGYNELADLAVYIRNITGNYVNPEIKYVDSKNTK